MSDLPAMYQAMGDGNVSVLKQLHEQAKGELAVFQGLPCNGRLASPPREDRDPRYIVDCRDEYAVNCIMRDHRGCPRVIREARRSRGLVESSADRRAHLRRLGIPDEFAILLAGTPPRETKGVTAARMMLEDRSQRMLVLSGGARSGKSYSASWAVAQASSSGMFMLSAQLGDRARDKQQKAKMHAVRVLAIDDVGTEFVDEKGWINSIWDGLIVERYDAGLQTVLTTNKGPATFKALYGERIASRIWERGKFADLGNVPVLGRQPGEEG